MAEPKKLTTEEILALARQKKAAAAAAAAEGAAPAPAAEAPAAPAEPAAAPPADKPQSTADILAAARAGKPAAPAGEKPKSTADILAAARAGAASKPAAAAPKSTADILAAARAKGGGAAKPAGDAPAAKPAAATAPAAPAGDVPALKDMVAAVKAAGEGKPIVVKAAAKPKLPAKPAPAAAAAPVTRRGMFLLLLGVLATPFVLAWTAMAAIAGLWGLATARFMMPNMVLELPSKFKVGPASDYPPGAVSEKYKASRGIWIVHSDQYDGRDTIYALASVCTHLGCTPNWLEGEQKFKCPCHGSGFYITGINFEGPAPRPLERVGLRRSEDGMLEVDKSVKFQEELGQWADGKSFFQLS